MYLPKNSSRVRQAEAQHARDNRAEIVKALSIGQVTRRDLFKWGIFTGAGYLAAKNGLSPFARSAYASVPTGTPRTPLFGATKFSQPMHRLEVQKPIPLTRDISTGNAVFPAMMGERDAKRLSWHNEFTANPSNPDVRNPKTNRGPIEGRPPGETFAHQRWDEYFPKVGYVMTVGNCNSETYFHPNMAHQNSNRVWSFGSGQNAAGNLPPPLFKVRYGEPVLTRIYNNLPTNRADNGGFGRNEHQLHFHNAHNGAESDGAANVHHFPGTFYDYRWSTTLARADKINTQATEARASGPDGTGGLVNIAGDFRELQGTMWAHDHRFFFTAENVYKGMLAMVNYYSGPDRGCEILKGGDGDSVNLRLPSGSALDWGNIDFDVNLVFSDAACDRDGQMFFDIFNTDGFLGDVPLVNFAYKPYFNVLPRKYRFRILAASMSRFWKLGLFDASGRPVVIQQIANDGNLFVNPITLTALDQQGIAERYDIIVDFSKFRVGDKIHVANLLRMRDDGRGPAGELSYADALKKSVDEDPVLGDLLQFRVVSGNLPGERIESVDAPGTWLNTANSCGTYDKSRVPLSLTEQIPIVTPVRTRVVEFGRAGTGDSRGADGKCVPECPETASFPWTIKINGQAAHSMNANRVSMLIPKAGEVEHWTYINGGGGWDHPIHLHFEEGVTMNRGSAAIPATERNARKDVWRLGSSGRVQFQVQFGEYGGSYVNHCHNTVHEDFAMLMRIQLMTGQAGTPQAAITATPNPTEDGVFFSTPEILPEGDPRPPGTAAATTQSSTTTTTVR
jgi:FtsP/CotA-like multicopper oxidase with cupredoxin domain